MSTYLIVKDHLFL